MRGRKKRTWTSSRGVAVILYKAKKLGRGNYQVDFNVVIYGSKCLMCGRLGDMKSYEDEVERVCEVMTKKIFKSLGFAFPKTEPK